MTSFFCDIYLVKSCSYTYSTHFIIDAPKRLQKFILQKFLSLVMFCDFPCFSVLFRAFPCYSVLFRAIPCDSVRFRAFSWFSVIFRCTGMHEKSRGRAYIHFGIHIYDNLCKFPIPYFIFNYLGWFFGRSISKTQQNIIHDLIFLWYVLGKVLLIYTYSTHFNIDVSKRLQKFIFSGVLWFSVIFRDFPCYSVLFCANSVLFRANSVLFRAIPC